jgi:hypothetical protein
MEQIPSGTELVRPFLPAKDFEVSKAFYEALGFEKSGHTSKRWTCPEDSRSRLRARRPCSHGALKFSGGQPPCGSRPRHHETRNAERNDYTPKALKGLK